MKGIVVACVLAGVAAGAVDSLGTGGACLANVAWGSNDKVWAECLAGSDKVAADAVLPMGAGQPGNLKYAPEEIRRTPADVFLGRMLKPEPGYGQFAALIALAEKAKQSDVATRWRILSLVIEAMKDKRRPVYQRYQCCYALSGSGDERGVPSLARVLLEDESQIMRAVAAEALADFANNTAAHDTLLQAARQETSPRVREVLARRLGSALPAGRMPPGLAQAVEERAPGGPPQPPPGPRPPVSKCLP